MSARYAPVPSSSSTNGADAERELNDAFESDNEDTDPESTPLTQSYFSTISSDEHAQTSASMLGAYDFERDYDYDRPPPGSPPRVSSFAIPNDIGNSNGQISTSPVGTTIPRLSFFHRAVGAILPTHYVRVPTSDSSVARPGVRGGGIENDGVFANVMAKPSKPVQVQTDDGGAYVVPEDSQSQALPSYADAQADAVPSYWENTIHAPSGLGPDSDMLVEDLPSGSILIFGANLFVSFFFQFVGFLLTYLLHTSHAAKYGSRAGLGLTLIQYGFYSRVSGEENIIAGNSATSGDPLNWPPGIADSPDAPLLSTSPTPTTQDTAKFNGDYNSTTRIWLSFLLMTLGWFLLLSSLIGYWRIKRWETSLRASSTHAPVTPDGMERDAPIRRGLVFRIFSDEDATLRAVTAPQRSGSAHSNIIIPDHHMHDQARLIRDLRAAGLL